MLSALSARDSILCSPTLNQLYTVNSKTLSSLALHLFLLSSQNAILLELSNVIILEREKGKRVKMAIIDLNMNTF